MIAQLLGGRVNLIFVCYTIVASQLLEVLFNFAFFFKKNSYLFIYLFLAALGLCCCTRAFSSCSEQEPLFVAVRGPLTAVASPAVEHGPRRPCVSSCGSWASAAVAHRLSCCAACGILLDQDLNLCPLHWQADSQPLRHQGIPQFSFLKAVLVLLKKYEFEILENNWEVG